MRVPRRSMTKEALEVIKSLQASAKRAGFKGARVDFHVETKKGLKKYE